MNEDYIPGVCNIGPGERKKRKVAAVMAIVFLLAATALIFLFAKNIYWRSLLFIPAAGTALTVQQWYHRFCYRFGMTGIFRFDQHSTVKQIESDEFLKLDRQKAQRMMVYSVLFAIVYTAVCLLIPAL